MVPYLMIFVMEAALPLYLAVALARRTGWTRRDLGLQVLSGTMFLWWGFLALPWGFFWYPLRFVGPFAFFLAAVWAARTLRREERTRTEPAKHSVSPLWMGLFAVVFGIQVVSCVKGTIPPRGAVDVAFPLREGTALVGHGGADRTINYHYAVETQRYALDIVGLNGTGAKARGIAPKDLKQYAIYGRPVLSPCDGTVLSIENALPEKVPPASDSDHPAGNHVEIETNGIRIFLAHLQPGSVRVKPGDRIRVGDPIGLVGNSGNTSEPHLHVHAVRGGKGLREGKGVPLTFDGRFLVRNDLASAR
jgi:hypothetical protein